MKCVYLLIKTLGSLLQLCIDLIVFKLDTIESILQPVNIITLALVVGEYFQVFGTLVDVQVYVNDEMVQGQDDLLELNGNI